MIRTLIVEDEPPVARVAARLVEQHPDFEVAGVEPDGAAALRRIARERVDMVVTDVRMPVMDGLTLLQSIHERYPEIFTVMLSGYEVFDYAKTAIEYQAFDYLLKPLSKSKLFPVLDRIAAVWNEQELERRRRQITLALEDKAPSQDSGDANCCVLLACAGAYPEIGVAVNQPGQQVWNSVDYGEWLRERGALAFPGSHGGERVVGHFCADPAEAERMARDFYEFINADGGVPVTVCAHCAPLPLSELRRAVECLRSLLYREIGLFRPQFFWCDCAAKAPLRKRPASQIMPLPSMVEAVLSGDEQRLTGMLRQSLEPALALECTQMDYVRFLDALLNDGRITHSVESSLHGSIRAQLSEAIIGARSPDELSARIAAILLPLGADSGRGGDIRDTIEQMEQYLLANYNKPISSKLLASKFGFTPAYLTRMFRQYKQTTPSEYLVSRRIEKSKELIEEHPDMRVRDVAVSVGFRDTNYFSRVFKRQTGVWPTEYQEKATCRS